MDPWKDRPLENRPKNEKKFSLKNKTDRLIALTIGAFVLVLVVVLIIILVVI